MIYRTSTGDRELLRDMREEGILRNPAHSRLQAKRGRRRRLLARLLAAALFVAFVTGSTSYRMHLEMRWEQEGQEASGLGGEAVSGISGGALAGMRSWLSGTRSRRSLREGLTAASDAPSANKRDAGAQGLQLFNQWWLIGGDGEPLLPESHHDAAAAAATSEEDTGPLHQLLRQRRLHPGAMRLYDFAAQTWVPHNLSKFPQEVPVARWGVATLLNKAKKKESTIFLVGGYMSQAAEAAARRLRKPPRLTSSTGGTAAGRSSANAAATITSECPLASATVFSINPGRTKVRWLPALPTPCYGATAVVAGARLHVFGGWTTPDNSTRLAVPATKHWSIGLNADGTSAPEWQGGELLPAALWGRQLTAFALTHEEDGEPAIYMWASSSSSSLAVSEAACREALSDGDDVSWSSADGNSWQQPQLEEPAQLWSFAGSSWRLHGALPEPLAADIQCAVAATSYQLLAVGAVERSGLFSHQRGVWEYDARNGGRWTRVGWAPPDFKGHLCAIYRGRLFVSRALPPHPGVFDADEAEEELSEQLTQQRQRRQLQVKEDKMPVAAVA